MVEAILLNDLEANVPGQDVVVLEVTDGETWASRKLGKITGVIVGHNVNTDNANINTPWSGNVVTINANGVTNEKMTLLMFGTA